MKIKLTETNLDVLITIKNYKKGASLTSLAGDCMLSLGGVEHHIKRLKKAGKIKQDKKTKLWFVK